MVGGGGGFGVFGKKKKYPLFYVFWELLFLENKIKLVRKRLNTFLS